MKQDRDLEVVFMNPRDLLPYANNAKIHSEEQVEKIAKQIDAFGFDQPIVVEDNLQIIKGHGRRLAALKRGLSLVPVVIAKHLDKHQAMAARIGDNKVSEAPWDPELLKLDLSALSALPEFDVEMTGIDLSQIQGILAPPTSATMFDKSAHQNVGERKDAYEQSDMRQLILVMDPATFEALMGTFAELQTKFGVETNLEVVQKLVEHHAAN